MGLASEKIFKSALWLKCESLCVRGSRDIDIAFVVFMENKTKCFEGLLSAKGYNMVLMR